MANKMRDFFSRSLTFRIVAIFALSLLVAQVVIYGILEKVCPEARTHEIKSFTSQVYEEELGVRSRDLPSWIVPYRKSSTSHQHWCKQLQSSPRARPQNPLYGECGRKHNHVLCEDGKPSFFGRNNEDIYTWSRHFRYLNRTGVFLDVAANEPVSRSNTYFYEQCLGWRGVCVEANPAYYPVLRSRRTCSLVKRCVSNQNRKVEFVDSDGFGGVLETNKNICVWARGKNSRQIECIKTDDALAKVGEFNIDFMSLDVEGHELFVLQGIDWSRTKINVIVTESKSNQVRTFLQDRGFRYASVERPNDFDALRGESMFIHKSVTWGKPE